MRFTRLFTPGMIGNVEVPNRYVQTPVQTRGGDELGYVTPELVAFHRARSHDGQGAGLVIAQQTFAWPAVKLARGLALWADSYIEKMAALATAIKTGGSRAFLQLGGSGSRLAGINLAPSPVVGSWDMRRPTEISRAEMMANLEKYASAGKRLYEAGFEGFSLHAAAGKYLAQFLSPWSNRRTDEFGGSPANRVRYLIMIIEAIRERTRSDFPVILRMPVEEFYEGGLNLSESVEQTAILSEAGVDAFLFSGGGQESLWPDCPPYTADGCPMVPSLRKMREALPSITIIANCGIHSPQLAEKLLENGTADFIGINRPLLADPDYIAKVREGRLDSIRWCIRCNNCQTWVNRPHLAGRGMCCTVNPALMVEETFLAKPAEKRGRIVVVGAGLAGMSAAAELAERGHQVILYEKTGEPGGQWLAASAGQEKGPFRTLTASLLRRLEAAGVEMRLNSRPEKQDIIGCKPDFVILATGATPRSLAGVDFVPDEKNCGVKVMYGIDVLRGASVPGKKVVVLGGRYIGIETALLLSSQGYEVSIVEMTELGRGMVPRIRSMLFERLAKTGTRVFANSSLFRVACGKVDVAHGGAVFPLEADCLVLCIGTVPNRYLQDCDFGVPTFAIGDCLRIGDAREAVAQGTELGLKL